MVENRGGASSAWERDQGEWRSRNGERVKEGETDMINAWKYHGESH